MKKLITILLLLPIALAGCVSSSTANLPVAGQASNGQAGRVVIYRSESLQAGLAKAYIGINDGYFTQLAQNEFLTISVDPGFHQFKARAQGSVASKHQIKINPGETVCVAAKPNHEELEWLAVPFVNALVPSFVLEETQCPELTAYSQAKSS